MGGIQRLSKVINSHMVYQVGLWSKIILSSVLLIYDLFLSAGEVEIPELLMQHSQRKCIPPF